MTEPRARTNRVFIALGSNIDAERNVREAVRRLSGLCTLIAVSRVYETAPVGNTGQPRFLNAAVLVETGRQPAEFKAQVLQAIENQLGRVRTADKNAPRTIDLDITMFGDQVLDIGERHIPDPDLLGYPHIALPMADLAPEFRHPETGQTLREIAEGMDTAGLQARTEIWLDMA